MRYASLESRLALPDDSFIKEKNHLSIAISLKETSRASVFAATNPFALFRASKMALDLGT
jgi:hypothetical protein